MKLDQENPTKKNNSYFSSAHLRFHHLLYMYLLNYSNFYIYYKFLKQNISYSD
jgi:hypothetical protein